MTILNTPKTPPFETVDLLYGRSSVSVHLPHSVTSTVIRKTRMPVIADPGTAIDQAFKQVADGTASLSSLAEEAQSVCIAICDITRPVPNHLFLRPLIKILLRSGIKPSAITVLVATGLHRPNEGEELRELVGDDWVLNQVQVVNHFATRDEDHVDLGITPTRRVPVKIDRRFADADLKIATGLVEPHFMAGYSGGRKVIAPGLAHADTIRTFHNHAFMSDPSAANCNLLGNPLHEEQLEIVRMLGGAYAINTVIDEERRLSFVNFGEIISSHQRAVEYVQKYCRAPVPHEFGVVLTSGAGYPLDQTYYQTVKGMVGAIDILKSGGDLFIVSQCAEGLGSPDYQKAQQRLVHLGDEAFLRSLSQKATADIDEWQCQMQTKATSKARIHLLSTIERDRHSLTGVEMYDDLVQFETALQTAATAEGQIAVIPEGPYVIPYLEKRNE